MGQLASAVDQGACLGGLLTAAAAAVALELRLRGCYLDAAGAMGAGAGAALRAEASGGAGAKALGRLHRQMPRDAAARLLAPRESLASGEPTRTRGEEGALDWRAALRAAWSRSCRRRAMSSCLLFSA